MSSVTVSTKKETPQTNRIRFAEITPYREIEDENPVYHYESRNLRWGRTPDDLRRHSRRWISRPTLAILALTLLVVIFMLLPGGDVAYSIFWSVWVSAFGISLLDKFVLDFSAVLTNLDTFRRDIDEGRWDLLNLTDVSMKKIVTAKYITAQIRGWRTMSYVVGFRLGIALSGLVMFLVVPIFFQGDYIMTPYVNPQPDEMIFTFFGVLFLIEISALYVIEPRWRLRALSAGSIAIATQMRDNNVALLFALGAILYVWFGQLVMGAVAMFAMSFFGGVGNSLVVAGMCLTIYALGVWFVIAEIYRGMTSNWLNRAHKRLVKRGGTA